MKTLKVDNWPAFLLQRLHSMYQSGYKCDTILRFANEPTTVTIKVHSMVLNASTRFFELLPKTRLGPYTTMTLPFGIGYKELSAIINFLYTGQLEFKEGDPLEIYQLSQRLQVDILVKLLSVRFRGVQNVQPDELLLRSDRVEFKVAPRTRGVSNIVLEGDEVMGRASEEDEDEDVSEEEFDENDVSLEEPGRKNLEANPINLPVAVADPVKLKIDPDDMDFEMATVSRSTRKRVRNKEGTRLNEETTGSEAAVASPRSQGTAGNKPGRSVVDQIADDWDEEGFNEDEEDDRSSEGSRDSNDMIREPVAKKRREEDVKRAQTKTSAEIDDDMVSQVIQKIPKFRDAAKSGRNVKIVQKTVGKEELLQLQRGNSDGKRLACLVLKTVDSGKQVAPKTPTTASQPAPAAVSAPVAQPAGTPRASRYTDWQCNLCREIERPHTFQSLQQLRSHYAGVHDMSTSVLCKKCGQDAPRRLASILASFVTYSSVLPNPQTHLRCANCHYVVIMTPKRVSKTRAQSPDPVAEKVTRKPDKSKPLQCKECGLNFRTAYNLSMHQKARHPRSSGVGETRHISVDAENGVRLDQFAFKAPDGTLLELATTSDGQHVIIPEADLKPEILGECTYAPGGIELSENGTEQYVYVPVDVNDGGEPLFSEDGSPLKCFTVGEDGALMPTETPAVVESPIVAQPVDMVEAAELSEDEGDAVLTDLSGPAEPHDADLEEPFVDDEDDDVKPEDAKPGAPQDGDQEPLVDIEEEEEKNGTSLEKLADSAEVGETESTT